MLADRLEHIRARERFRPGFFALFVNPFFLARRDLFVNLFPLGRYIRGKVLDVGCGEKPYERICNADQYIGLEIDTPENRKKKRADFFYDGNTFPFQGAEFDSVVTSQVFEHVFNPDQFLREIYRVLKPGGMLLLTVPFVWDEHEQPCDFARYSSFGLKWLIEKNGLEIMEFRKSLNDIRAVFQILNGYTYKKTVTRNRLWNLITTLFLIAPFNVLGVVMSKILPKNDDLYLDNIVLAKKGNFV